MVTSLFLQNSQSGRYFFNGKYIKGEEEEGGKECRGEVKTSGGWSVVGIDK